MRAARLQKRTASLVPCFVVACLILPLPLQRELREGEEALAVGDPADALARFERAHELEPNHPEALRGLALAEQRLGRPAAALAWFDQLEWLRPDHFDPELTKARCDALLAAVDGELGREASAEALALARGSRAASLCRGEALRDLIVRAHMALAERALEANELTAATDHLESVLARQPGHPGATLERARLLRQGGARDAAVRLLSEALSHHPKDRRLIEAAVELLAAP